MNRSDRKRQAKDDERLLARGIVPETRDPSATAAMARSLLALLETAKTKGDIGPAVKFLHAKVEATLAAQPIPVACTRSCAHCCHTWVSATAPEALYAARAIRARGPALVEKVKAAQAATADLDFAARARFPAPCPILEDNLCSLYESRPAVCRFASSMSAEACERVLRLLARETIPTPARHVQARAVYEIAMTIALIRAGLPHRYYEFNAALARALAREDAEAAWLAGEDVFAGVRLDPNDTMATRDAQAMYRFVFDEAR
jgi:Fe-S-cluster containining protein